VRFWVLTTVNRPASLFVFWVATPCNLTVDTNISEEHVLYVMLHYIGSQILSVQRFKVEICATVLSTVYICESPVQGGLPAKLDSLCSDKHYLSVVNL
jgi:hypothetical protein